MASVRSFPTFSSYLRLVLIIAAAIILPKSFVNADLTRQECLDLGGLIVGDIGDGSSQQPGYLCASNGQPIIDIVVPLPGEPIADEGEVCCGQDNGTLTRQGCTDLGGLIVNDIGDGSSRQPGYLCESNGQPIIGIVVPLPGEPIAREGEVCCGQDSGTLTRQECTDLGGLIVADIGDGSSRQPDYRCASDGQPIIGIVVPLPGEPLSDEGEVCCGQDSGTLTRQGCTDLGGLVVGDIGDGSSRQPDYLCASNGQPIIGIVEPLPGEPIAVEGEVCCGQDSGTLTRQGCTDLGGLVVGDIGDGSSRQPDYLCASNGQPIIGIVEPLPGEPIAVEGEVCCGQDSGTLTRQGCTDLGGLVVGDIGDGSSRQPDYLCASNGQPIIGIVVPLPGEPLSDEGEVCCGQDSGTLTRQECTDLGGLVVGDIGDGSSRQPGYLCASNGQPIIGIVEPLPGEPIAVEGEVCCGQDSGTLTRQECTDLGGLVVGDIGDGSSRQPDYLCASNGQPIIGIVVPLPGEPIAVEGEVCCGQDSGTLTRQECTDLGGLIVADIGDGSSREPDYLCASNGQPIIGIVMPLPGEPISDEGEVCCGQDSGTLTRQECTDLGGLIVGDIGDGSSRQPGYLCASNGQPIIGIVVPLPGEPIADEGEVCCGQDSGPGPAGCPATIPENVGEGFPVMHYQHQHIRRKGYGKMKSCPCRLESIVALGDSFSDVGNAFLSDVCDPPTTGVFCNQRNSNGALVVEYLAASLNVGPMSIAFALGGNNFAVAGASSSPADTNSIVTQAFFYGIATGLLPDDPENPSPIPPGYLEPSNSKRLHTITAGGNEVVDAVISDIATFLGYENVQETSLTPEGFVRAGADGLGVILSTLLSLPGVCNVLLYTTSDVGTTPLTLALDKFYASQGHPGVSKRATEYSLLSVKLFEREVANVQDAFDSKCHAAGAEFGIHLINSLELAKRVDGRLFPKTKTSCNHHYTVSQAVCEATAAPALLEVPYIPMSEDGSLVWCRFNAAPPVNCDCKGYKLFDEFHPTTAFNREFSDLSLHILNNICHDLY